MEDYKKRQARHLKTILDEQGITKSKLAKVGGVSAQSVTAWMKGDSGMRDFSARRIHDEWPEYPIEWICGFTDYKNGMDEAAAHGETTSVLGDCLLQLAGWSFSTYELDFDPNTTKPTYWVEGADEFITSPMVDGWWSYAEFDPESDRHFITMATLMKDGNRLDMPLLAWYQFLQQQVNRFDFEIKQQMAAQSDLAFMRGYGRTETGHDNEWFEESERKAAQWQSNFTGAAVSRKSSKERNTESSSHAAKTQ